MPISSEVATIGLAVHFMKNRPEASGAGVDTPNGGRPIVSILTPSFNSARYIGQAIESVQRQTLENWEMIIVDDGSNDTTLDVVRAAAESDTRIRFYMQDRNMGAGPARNRALEMSQGRFIAYLDADDLWHPSKLRTQIDFMTSNGLGFTCCSYQVVDETGFEVLKTIRMLPRSDYWQFLTHNLLQTVGIVVDTQKVDPDLLRMPSLRRRQDAATWLQVLKAGHTCHGLDEPLAKYRRTPLSLSSNKVKAARGVWFLYRDVESLSLPASLWCFARYATLAIWKRTYPERWYRRVPLVGTR